MDKTLYKIDSKGKLRTLRIYNEDDEVVQIAGLDDGKKVTNRSKCVAKNIGRSNETTPQEQAESEAKAKIIDKLLKEYFLTEKEARDNDVILPMLAKDYKKEKKKVIYPCYAQPKLDGMRCFGSSNSMISRDNKVISTMDHIQSELLKLDDLRLTSDIYLILDGELYVHGLTFQENMKLIKKKRDGSEDVIYHVYDLVSDKPFLERYRRLQIIAKELGNVEVVPTYIIRDEKDMLEKHAMFLSQGYEGTIIRWGDVGYQINKKSSYLLKYKDFLDEAFLVVDVVPSKRRPEQGVVVLEKDGKQFQAGMKFSHAEREEMLRNKKEYIGKTAEIRFFEYTDDGLPRFPVCVGFRLDK